MEKITLRNFSAEEGIHFIYVTLGLVAWEMLIWWVFQGKTELLYVAYTIRAIYVVYFLVLIKGYFNKKFIWDSEHKLFFIKNKEKEECIPLEDLSFTSSYKRTSRAHYRNYLKILIYASKRRGRKESLLLSGDYERVRRVLKGWSKKIPELANKLDPTAQFILEHQEAREWEPLLIFLVGIFTCMAFFVEKEMGEGGYSFALIVLVLFFSILGAIFDGERRMKTQKIAKELDLIAFRHSSVKGGKIFGLIERLGRLSENDLIFLKMYLEEDASVYSKQPLLLKAEEIHHLKQNPELKEVLFMGSSSLKLQFDEVKTLIAWLAIKLEKVSWLTRWTFN